MRRQAGFTLVELMVALVLFGLLVAGVLSVAVTMNQGFTEQRQVIATDTDVRVPMDYLADAIRLASPGVPSGDITAASGDANCDYYGMFGGTATHAHTPADNTAIIATNNTVAGPAPGTDMLDITYAAGGVATSLQAAYTGGATLTVLDATGIYVGDMLLVSNGTQGHLFFVTGVPAVNSPPTNNITVTTPSACGLATLPAGGYPVNALVVRAIRARFALSRDPQSQIPTLYVAKYNGTTGAPPPIAFPPPAGWEAVAEGIEDMQIALGMDSNSDNNITSLPPINEWVFSPGGLPFLTGNPLRAVRLTLIGRASLALVGANAAGAQFFRPAAEDHLQGPNDTFRRRILTSTIETRNLGASL